MKARQWIGRFLVMAFAAGATWGWSAPAMTFDELLNKVQDKSLSWEERAKVWHKVGEMGAEAIPRLAEIIAAAPIQEDNKIPPEEKNRAKLAATALDFIAHYAKRPGADAERRAVNAELVKLIGRDQPAVLRIKALELLGLTGDDASVSAIAAVLRDPDPKMRERARSALDHIPGKVSVRALQAAIPAASVEFRRDLILTLGAKKAPEAVDLLLREAQSSNPTIQMAAVEALARIGDPRGLPAIEKAFKTWSGPDRLIATNDYLLLAETISPGNPDLAARIYQAVLRGAKSDAARCAALVGLGKTAGKEVFPLLVSSLADPSAKVRSAASNALVGMKGADADRRLIASARSSKPAVKAMILRVMARRSEKAPATQALLKEAARDPNAEVRVTALDLLGGLDDPSLERTLLEAAQTGSAQVRPVALRSYVRLADTRLKAGKADQALPMYHRVLDLAETNDVRRMALAGIQSIASTDSLGRIEKLLGAGSGVQDEAAHAYVAIVAKMAETNKAEAIERLSALVGKTRSPGVATAAIAELRKLGIDTAGFASKAGFITRWWLVGPFPFGGENGFDKSFFDETKIDVKQPVKWDGKTFAWKEVRTDDAQGKVNLEPLFRPNQNVAAYAYAEIDSPRDREITLLIGSDDGNIVWLNGKKVYSNNATRPIKVDQDRAKANLRKGLNRLLVKITQGGGQWEFCVRIGNPQGRPIDLSRWGMGGTR